MENSTAILFGLPGMAVRGVERVEGIRVVNVVTDDPGAAACPACGVFTDTVSQCRITFRLGQVFRKQCSRPT